MESKKKPVTSRLKLNELQVPVHIGVESKERELSQTVSFNVEVCFPSTPEACGSDQISDTVCYDQISRQIYSVCRDQKYALLEHLVQRTYQGITQLLPENTRLRVEATKVSPPIQGLQGGAAFEMSNF